MDKNSFFFTANCGVCHPGGGATQYDRNGKLYFDRSVNLFGYLGGVAALTTTSPPSGPMLDGDYGFINPATGATGVANWSKTGVLEADCLMCHMNQFATAPGTANHNNGLSWHKRSATLRGTGVAGVANFDWAPTAGAGWANVTYVAGASPPQASAVAINYGLGLTAGTLVDQAGNLTIPAGKISSAKDGNCRGCHAIPDGKKSGRTLLPTTDVHVAKGVSCTRCHTTPNEGVVDSKGVAMANPHQIGKGNITIGSVRNDLDNTVKSCTNCHIEGGDVAAPNPTTAHFNKVPGNHTSFINCQACHIRHLDDDPVSPTQDIPELVIEMTSNGTQNVSVANKYLGTDPLNPASNLPELAGKPFRWYPALRWWNNKITTVKPLYTAWIGEWVSGEGNSAVIKPVTLRLVRKALANNYAAGSARLGTLPITPGSMVATGAPILHKKEEIKATLIAMRDAKDDANTDTSANDIVTRPVLVRADKVYYLSALDEVEYFESIVGESHDFAVNHNTSLKRDPLNPVLTPGPYGSGGCNDCHGPNSTFFFGKQLAEPAEYDFLDEHGTIPNPNAGKPSYKSHYETMNYSKFKAEQLTARIVPTRVRGTGLGTVIVAEDGNAANTCTEKNGDCLIGVTPGSNAIFTAVPDAGQTLVGWSGCTPDVSNSLTCTANVGTPETGASNPGIFALAEFTSIVPPPPLDYTITVNQSANGIINPNTYSKFVAGASQTYTITPAAGYHVAEVLVDGADVGAVASYTFTDIQADHVITATFEANPSYTITVIQPSSGGSISPGTTTLFGGLSQTFAITPAAGYRVADVQVDGKSVGAVTSYSFYTIGKNFTLSASFVANGYTITASTTSANGTISPVGPTPVSSGGSQTFTITPNAGYKINYVAVNGASVGAVSSYTFTNVRQNYTIKADFVPITYKITVTQSAGGSISPGTYSGFKPGATQKYTITPKTGYTVADVKIDGVTAGAVTSYTFTDIQTNHSITATYAPLP